MSIRHHLPVALSLAAACFGAHVAKATIVDGPNGLGTANTTGPFPVAGLNNVGVVNFGPPSSGVYIGNNWALTAAHIGPSQNFPGATFTVGGSTFSIDSVHSILNSDSTAADIVAFHLTSTPSLPTLTLAAASPALGTTMYSMGDGLTRSATMTLGTDGHLEYTESNPPVLRYGSNTTTAPPNTPQTVSNNGTTEVINIGFGNTTIFSSTFGANTMQLSSGDSGGGVFGANNVLLGLNDLLFNFSGQTANTAAYGDESGYVDIASYAPQIASVTGVPEPAAPLLLGAAIPLLLRRRTSR